MRDLAAFVSSDEGRMYGATCERWGVDPGAIFDDDVLAYNMRVGLILAMAPGRDDEGSDHAALIEQTRRAGEEMRARIG